MINLKFNFSVKERVKGPANSVKSFTASTAASKVVDNSQGLLQGEEMVHLADFREDLRLMPQLMQLQHAYLETHLLERLALKGQRLSCLVASWAGAEVHYNCLHRLGVASTNCQLVLLEFCYFR